MPSLHGHKHSESVNQNRKAQLANAYNELGKELASQKVRVVGNYTLGKVIGEGAYGKVRLGTHRLTSTRVAIKQIPKAMSAALTREIHHHRQLHHPHITQMYEVIATESSIWIVTELCCGGELFDYLVEKGRLSEEETKVLFGQLCLAVAYLHETGIVHRDLKLENVLLDERCRVKLGDFGFTREYERGTFMETFCGTTGYAAPEMLQGKKYQGPEVDVWSLGVILYCLLTGTLPFDDDDEEVMKQKIIQGDFEDAAWLSLVESRDLLKNILVRDPLKRYTIPQILAHPWFTLKELTYEPDSPLSLDDNLLQIPRPSTPDNSSSTIPAQTGEHSTGNGLTNGRHGGLLKLGTEIAGSDPFNSSANPVGGDIAQTPTNRRFSTSDSESLLPATPIEEDIPEAKSVRIRPVSWSNSSGSKAPPAKIRTPARTKRRSVSSVMSLTAEASQQSDEDPTLTPLPPPTSRDLDFASLLTTPTPIIFSTTLERELLNTLSTLGLDTAQIVHSVLTDACDSAGALWWILRKKAEQRKLDEGDNIGLITSPIATEVPKRLTTKGIEWEDDGGSPQQAKKARNKTHFGIQTDPTDEYQQIHLFNNKPTPQLAFVPPTPTFARPTTPPRTVSPTRYPMLSPSSSTITTEMGPRSYPSTPGSSMKDKDGSKGRKNRSGSVSIMQRATTALEAAGLVRKKSSEAVREEREREREREREKSREHERRGTSGEESRSSHSNEFRHGPSKLTKSPPLKPRDNAVPATPPPSETHGSNQIGSPWVIADREASHTAGPSYPVSAIRGEMVHSHSAPNLDSVLPAVKPPTLRNRANILTSLRLWFNEDKKGKRKDPDRSGRVPSTPQTPYTRPTSVPGTGKRRGSNASTKVGRSNTHRAKRPSMSSRRSSSVNSRRSSVASMQIPNLDSPQQLSTVRAMETHTPNSERDQSSRPSSIHSISNRPRHRKSPSVSSTGSLHLRAASPIGKYHRRAGSGSSTRVIRQSVARPPHARSNSATSSIHSPPSSRPTSFYEQSETEAPRNSSPYRSRRQLDESTPRRPGSANGGTTFIAQKRPGPFNSPAFGGGTLGKSSWKKSWGLEPPGWQTRTAQLPVEVLVISTPSNEPVMLRDVFSGRNSLSQAGDDSDWIDEDDDIPFAGGLGQQGASISSSSTSSVQANPEPVVTLSPAPRGNRSNKRNTKAGSATGTVLSGRSKPSQSPAGRHSPLPPESTAVENRGGRRQLPAGRAGPAFKHAIQEEDEDEEED
ncbi:Pkinase-domain-containing protein [Coprinopsis marcescibilis]|uniref:Pkinase-domain-containing protein n=1 Tax=Coprinopsis marcescibilis TaxID=230819 RepID=A0A5C3KRP3_COPMA|nr:Pkinase-domain-containing protein [Coprinopsis marcescibilis]